MPDFPDAGGHEFPAVMWPGHPDSLGQFYLPGSNTYGAAAVPTQNRGFLIPFIVSKTVTIARMGVLNGATVNGNFDVGIYDSSFRLIVSAGATAQSGANNAQFVNIADTVLNPGFYYMAFSQSSATGTYQQMPTLDAAAGWLAAINAGQAAALMGVLVMAAAHPLPATFTAAAPSAAGDDVPPFVFLYRSAT